jgi:hypothetical protein
MSSSFHCQTSPPWSRVPYGPAGCEGIARTAAAGICENLKGCHFQSDDGGMEVPFRFSGCTVLPGLMHDQGWRLQRRMSFFSCNLRQGSRIRPMSRGPAPRPMLARLLPRIARMWLRILVVLVVVASLVGAASQRRLAVIVASLSLPLLNHIADVDQVGLADVAAVGPTCSIVWGWPAPGPNRRRRISRSGQAGNREDDLSIGEDRRPRATIFSKRSGRGSVGQRLER